MKFMFGLAFFMVADLLAFWSVPQPIRQENHWAILPAGGFILAAEYHFGNKLKATPLPVTSSSSSENT